VTSRFTTSVYHIDISDDRNLILAGSGDFTLKLIKLDDGTQKTFEGHEAPILSVALDPKGECVASSSCDGSVRIWTIEEQNCLHSWNNNHPKSNDFANSLTLCRISWEKVHGQLIAIPTLSQVNVVDRDSWEVVKTYGHDELTNITITAFSPNGHHLAVADTSGTIMIWDTKTSNSSPIAKFFHPNSYAITCLKWNPKDETSFCFCDFGGQFGLVTVKSLNENSSIKSTKEVKSITREECDQMFGELSDDDDFMNQVADSLLEDTKNKMKEESELPEITFNPKMIGKTKVSATNSSNATSIERVIDEMNDQDFEMGDDNEFDIGKLKSQYESKIFGEDDGKGDRSDSRASKMSKSIGDNKDNYPVQVKAAPTACGTQLASFYATTLKLRVQLMLNSMTLTCIIQFIFQMSKITQLLIYLLKHLYWLQTVKKVLGLVSYSACCSQPGTQLKSGKWRCLKMRR
jgi:WD40 repeat protein